MNAEEIVAIPSKSILFSYKFNSRAVRFVSCVNA